MTAFSRCRLAAVLTALTAAVPVAAAVSGGEWAAAVGLDVWNLPGLRAEAEEEAERGESLEAVDDDVCRRIEIKEALVNDLIAGRTTLADVTARFLELNQVRPEYMAAIRANYPGDTDEEKTARNVLEYAAARLAAADPDRRAEVMHRLEAGLAGIGTTLSAGTH